MSLRILFFGDIRQNWGVVNITLRANSERVNIYIWWDGVENRVTVKEICFEQTKVSETIFAQKNVQNKQGIKQFILT